MDVMVIRVVEFLSGRYKIGKIFALNITYPKEILNWCYGRCQKLDITFENKVISKLMLSKNPNNKEIPITPILKIS